MHGKLAAFDRSGRLSQQLPHRVTGSDLRTAEVGLVEAAAQQAAGAKFILAPGCSVPNDTADEELLRLVNVLGA